MVTRSELVREAMRLIGTPFVHQQRQPGVGMDCCGTVVVPVQSVGLPLVDLIAYRRHPNPETFIAALDAQLDRVCAAPKYGDVGACWTNESLIGKPHHLFWLVPGPQLPSMWMLHTWHQAGGVVHVPYSSPWPERTYGFWSIRGLEN